MESEINFTDDDGEITRRYVKYNDCQFDALNEQDDLLKELVYLTHCVLETFINDLSISLDDQKDKWTKTMLGHCNMDNLTLKDSHIIARLYHRFGRKTDSWKRLQEIRYKVLFLYANSRNMTRKAHRKLKEELVNLYKSSKPERPLKRFQSTQHHKDYIKILQESK